MKKVLPYMLLLILSFSACSKKNGAITPEPTTGSLSGIISPAGAVKSISIISSTSVPQISLVTPDPVTGVFSLTNLPEGSYRLEFSTEAHYIPVASVSTVVTKGKNTDIGMFTTKEINFTLSYNINSVFEGWLYKAYYPSSSGFSIGPLSIGTYPEDMRTAYYPSIILYNVSGPGTYICNGTTKSSITYSGYRLGSGFRISYQSTEYSGGEGTVIITSIDPATRTIKGTFTATLTSASGSSVDTKVMTNGIINASY